jgi:iron complex outermembrane receptor protein
MSKTKFAWLASTAMAGSLIAGQAFAQSTGSQELEAVVITAASGPRAIEGLAVAEREPKSRASLTQDYLQTQAPGQTILQSLNLLPGVNFTNNDPFGSAGGDITLRGFDSQRTALLQDGVPLNDSGNYAIYPNQQMEPDLIERAQINLGATDVDSPTAAAAGGTINYITRKPSERMGGRFELGYGGNAFSRYYGTLESGAIGPWGTKMWVSGLYTRNDIFRPYDAQWNPAGKIEKKQFNAYIRQDFSRGFVGLIFNYNENRNAFINRINLANFTQRTAPVYFPDCPRPTPAAGTAQNDACTNFVGGNINPSNTGNIRGLSSFRLTDSLTLTVDPSFQYVLANGGGIQAIPENDPQLRGTSAAAGVDLNGDGDVLDRVFLYRPNTTNTRRYGVTSSLIWRMSDDHSFRIAYTFDRAKHRQTGDFGYVDALGFPENPFAGKDGYGRVVRTADGQKLRRRDRYSVALLNQVAAEYRGQFFEDRLLVNVGLRAPFFKRNLNNYCFQQNTFNAYCTTQTPTPVPGTNDGTGRPLVTFPLAALNSTASFQYGWPRSFQRKYDKVLPNVAVGYNLSDDLSVYASYSQTLSAPRTDDLYDQVLVDPGPEINNAYDAGVRYTSGIFSASGSVWASRFKNRIERVLDEPTNVSFSQNVGKVNLWGLDGQVGVRPVPEVAVFASLSYINSEIQQDIRNAGAGILATKGKSLYETPQWQGGVRVTYDPAGPLRFGVQGKFVGDRWTNLVNTEKFPGYNLWDLDARFDLDWIKLNRSYLQLNVINLFDERWLGDISPNLTGTALAQPGYRRTYTVTLHAEF